MLKPGYRNDFIYHGICGNCGAEYEASPEDIKTARKDQNCPFCQGVRTIRFEPVNKAQYING